MRVLIRRLSAASHPGLSALLSASAAPCYGLGFLGLLVSPSVYKPLTGLWEPAVSGVLFSYSQEETHNNSLMRRFIDVRLGMGRRAACNSVRCFQGGLVGMSSSSGALRPPSWLCRFIGVVSLINIHNHIERHLCTLYVLNDAC